MFSQPHFAHSDFSLDDEYELPPISPPPDDEYGLPPISPQYDEYALPPTSPQSRRGSTRRVSFVTPESPFTQGTPSPPSSDDYSLPPISSRPAAGHLSLRLDQALGPSSFPRTVYSPGNVIDREATQPAVAVLSIRFLPWTWDVKGTGGRLPQGGRAVTIRDILESLSKSLYKRAKEAEFRGESHERQMAIQTVFLSRVDGNQQAYSNGVLRYDFLEGHNVLGLSVHKDPNTIELIVDTE